MVLNLAMNSEYINKLREYIENIVGFSNKYSTAEDDTTFSLKIYCEKVKKLTDVIEILSVHYQDVTITINVSVQNGHAVLEVSDNNDLLVFESWDEDQSLTPKSLDQDSLQILLQLAEILKGDAHVK